MFFTIKKNNTFRLCFKIIFFYILIFQHDIPSDSFYIVGKSLQCDTIEEWINDTPYQNLYDILDEIYYLNVYIDKLKELYFKN